MKVLSRGLLTLAVLCAWLLTYLLGASALRQEHDQRELYNELRQKLSSAEAPLGGPIDPGTPVALIVAPAIGMSQVIVEGTDGDVMRSAPGHRRDTPLPGQPGTSVVYGHAAAYGAPFGDLTALAPGDHFTVTTGLGEFDYEVQRIRHANDPTPAPLQKGGSRLILATAEGQGWRTGWATDRVVYVDSVLKGDPKLGPPGRPSMIDVREKAMQANPDALVPLVLWLQLLAAAAFGGTWAARRWGALQTWIVGVPAILATIWGVTDALGQLLPNLI
ncbi:sortase domain-bontaining protein [Dactylosporangium sp. NPDC048998]|uniref:sortase domain-containing protein n=1 Tax=Dactylosporangium sp. NPDC048998 TaxID=3363976 RepID=UPI0037205ADC